MLCPNCDKSIIWNNDFDSEDDESPAIISCWSCPECETDITIRTPLDNGDLVYKPRTPIPTQYKRYSEPMPLNDDYRAWYIPAGDEFIYLNTSPETTELYIGSHNGLYFTMIVDTDDIVFY